MSNFSRRIEKIEAEISRFGLSSDQIIKLKKININNLSKGVKKFFPGLTEDEARQWAIKHINSRPVPKFGHMPDVDGGH